MGQGGAYELLNGNRRFGCKERSKGTNKGRILGQVLEDSSLFLSWMGRYYLLSTLSTDL